MKTLLFLLSGLFTFVIFANAQKTDVFENTYPSVTAGVNISKLLNDSMGSKAASLPFINLGLNKSLAHSFGTTLNAGYSLRGANVESPFSKYRFQYIDLQLAAYYNISQNIVFETGFSPSFVYKSLFIKGTDSIAFLPKQNFSSEFDVFTGIALKFQGNSSLGVRYFFPIKNSSFQNFQIFIQIPLNFSKQAGDLKTNENKSALQIEELKNGVLLVRLKTSENAINYLIQQGKADEAEKLKEQQKIVNLEIVNAFRQHFNFCPVYFFYSNQTDKILNHEFQNVFLNTELKVDSSITINTVNYFFAEFDILETGNEASTGTGIEALIVKDRNLKQLSKPFPFYVRKNELMMGTRNIKSVVVLLNFNLTQYYNTIISGNRK